MIFFESKFIKKLFGEARQVSLSWEERVQMRANLVEFMRIRPAQSGVRLARANFLAFAPRRLAPITASILAGVMLVGGGAYAAENTLPGDILYPVKIRVTEEIREALTISDQAKAEWATRRAERRLEEAEQLAQRGNMSAQAQVEMQENFEEQAERARERIEKLEENNDHAQAAAEIGGGFETSLRIHEEIISRLAEDEDNDNDEDAKSGIRAMAKSVKERSNRVSQAREKSEFHAVEESRARQSAEAQAKVASRSIEEAQRILSENASSVSATALYDAQQRISLSQQLVVEGEAALDAEAYGDAFAKFQKAHRIAKEAQVILRAKGEFKLKFKNGIRIGAGLGEDDDDDPPSHEDADGQGVEDGDEEDEDISTPSSTPKASETHEDRGDDDDDHAEDEKRTILPTELPAKPTIVPTLPLNLNLPQ